MFLQTNMLHARVFPLVTFCAMLCLWAWWRVALRPRPPGRGAQFGLLLGATGLLYTHYYAVLLLPVLGLFHLLFVPRMRRWWRSVLLFGLAGLLASLQLPLLLQGLALNAASEDLHNKALTAPELLAQFLRYLSNGILEPTPTVGALLLLLLPLMLTLATLRHLRARRRADATWLLVFVCLALLLLFIAANESLRLIEESRLRYLIALWPLLAVAGGAGLHQLAGNHPRPGDRAGDALAGSRRLARPGPPNIRYELGYFFPVRVPSHLSLHARAHDRDELLIMDYNAAKHDPEQFYSWTLGVPREFLYRIGRILTKKSDHITGAIPTPGCSTSRRTAWASPTCRRSWDVCSASGHWTSGASRWSVMPAQREELPGRSRCVWSSRPVSR